MRSRPRSTTTVLVAALAMLIAHGLSAQSSAVGDVQRVEQEFNDSARFGPHPDEAKQEAFIAPEYIQTTIHANVYDRDIWMKSRAGIPRGGNTRTVAERVMVVGDLGLVTGRRFYDPGGEYSDAFTRVWIKKPNGWKLAAQQYSIPSGTGRPASAVAPPLAPTVSASSPEGQLFAVISERVASEVAFDPTTYDRLTADDFLFIGPTAQFSRKPDRPTAFRPGGNQTARADISDVRIHIYGEAALATYAESGTRLTTVWVHRQGRWQALHVHQTVIVNPAAP